MLKQLPLIAVIFLLGCRPAEQVASAPSPDLDRFLGCYSVEQGAPAQIKVAPLKDGLGMQMKEPDGSFDTLEPLKVLSADDAWHFFATNTLNLNKKDLSQSLGRHDEVMTLGLLNQEAVALNPHLDSPFVMALFGAVNTIYQVDCDTVPLQLAPSDGLHGVMQPAH